MPPHFGIFCTNNTRSNMVVVRNCDVGDFALVLVFLYFSFFIFFFFFTATKLKSHEQWDFFKKHDLLRSNI